MPSILLATVLTLSVLYAPQPLLPVLAREFQVSRESAALLTTIVFIPLSLAPLVYGYLLETVSAKRMLRVALLLLALTSAVIAMTTSFNGLLFWRLVQGLLIPALLTALMTYTAQTVAQGEVQRAMAWYISATIVGGFAGRAMSGMIASLLHWRASFLLLAASLLLAWFWLGRLPETGSLRLVKARFSLVREVLADALFRRTYAMIFCFFLVFAAIMNFLPFRLTELSARADEFRIGLAYSGYLMGLLASLNAVRIQRLLGGAERTMALALAVYALALLALLTPAVPVLLLTIFLFCGAMFLTHATASGLLNRRAGEHKGVVNGLYVAFYYGGGAIGSILPGYVYRGWGWDGFILVLLVAVLAALCLAMRLAQAAARSVE